ncbi:MAG TPA: hypothetical protein VFS10_03555 [Pyrinomonadaceae bacterium]|nr:hypothetical protein [Pyrinomonadaceae bacterium]
MSKKLKQKNDARTKLEVKMARHTPMPYELEALGQMIVKAIKKLPPEAQLPAVLAAEASIIEIKEGADAFVSALPGFPPSLSTKAIKKRAALLEAFYRHASPHSSPSIFKRGLNLLREVEEMVDPLGDDPPTIPHQLVVPFINRQARFLIKYVFKNALK